MATNEQKREMASKFEYEHKKYGKDFAIASVSIRPDISGFSDKKPKFNVHHSSGGAYTLSQLKKFIAILKKAQLLATKLNK